LHHKNDLVTFFLKENVIICNINIASA